MDRARAVPAAATPASRNAGARRAPPPTTPRAVALDTAASTAPTLATATARPLRAASIAIDYNRFKTCPKAKQVTALLGVLGWCVALAEQRARDYFGRGDIPAALMMIDVMLPQDRHVNASILHPLTTNFPTLVRSLRVLKIANNDYDESAALCAFAELAADLRELNTVGCGITSLRGLEGRCEHLRKVSLRGCKYLNSIGPLADRVYLEEVDISLGGITSIEPLRSCSALTKTYLGICPALSSIDALEGHQRLQVVDASCTNIVTIEPLRSCPALTIVDLDNCVLLTSIDALEGHPGLQVVDVSSTNITSIKPLRSCPALTKVYLRYCPALSSIDALEGHQWLQEVDASQSGITSIEPLRTCPALTKVALRHCRQLSSADVGLPATVEVELTRYLSHNHL